MLTTNQLITIFSKVKKKETTPDLSTVVDIIRNLNPEIGIDEDGMSYFFRIKLIDLSKSNISEDMIYNMADNGWVLSKDKKYIENFYQ